MEPTSPSNSLDEISGAVGGRGTRPGWARRVRWAHLAWRAARMPRVRGGWQGRGMRRTRRMRCARRMRRLTRFGGDHDGRPGRPGRAPPSIAQRPAAGSAYARTPHRRRSPRSRPSRPDGGPVLGVGGNSPPSRSAGRPRGGGDHARQSDVIRAVRARHRVASRCGVVDPGGGSRRRRILRSPESGGSGIPERDIPGIPGVLGFPVPAFPRRRFSASKPGGARACGVLWWRSMDGDRQSASPGRGFGYSVDSRTDRAGAGADRVLDPRPG